MYILCVLSWTVVIKKGYIMKYFKGGVKGIVGIALPAAIDNTLRYADAQTGLFETLKNFYLDGNQVSAISAAIVILYASGICIMSGIEDLKKDFQR